MDDEEPPGPLDLVKVHVRVTHEPSGAVVQDTRSLSGLPLSFVVDEVDNEAGSHASDWLATCCF
jgi:hypothetical protein